MTGERIFITGRPHSGKSTLLTEVLKDIKDKQGFVTLEIRKPEEEDRTGFMIQTAGGTEAVLASTEFNTPHQVSRYFVKPENLESVLPELSNFEPGDILYIDEIGQMENLSEKFKKLVRLYLDSGNTVIFTVSQVYSDEFIKWLFSLPDVHLVTVTKENREESLNQVINLIK